MRRLGLVLVACALSLSGEEPVAAQTSLLCEELPACPDDGARPLGLVLPGCSCPRPASCPASDFDHACTFSVDSSSWSCSCDRFEVRRDRDSPGPEPVPFDPPLGLCAGLLCNDGSTPKSDGFHCLCPAD